MGTLRQPLERPRHRADFSFTPCKIADLAPTIARQEEEQSRQSDGEGSGADRPGW